MRLLSRLSSSSSSAVFAAAGTISYRCHSQGVRQWMPSSKGIVVRRSLVGGDVILSRLLSAYSRERRVRTGMTPALGFDFFLPLSSLSLCRCRRPSRSRLAVAFLTVLWEKLGRRVVDFGIFTQH
jgi:hypothetical protein